MYLGCLLIPIVILLFLAIIVVRDLLNMGANAISILSYKIRLLCFDFIEFFASPFKPKPVESLLENTSYYHPTEERPKRYGPGDGIYISFKRIRK